MRIDRSFVSDFGVHFDSFVPKHFQQTKLFTNEHSVKCITWGVTSSRMLDGKADGRSQWFLSHIKDRNPAQRNWSFAKLKIVILTLYRDS